MLLRTAVICFIWTGSWFAVPLESEATSAFAGELHSGSLANGYTFDFQDVTLDQALYQLSITTGSVFIYESHLTKGHTVNRTFKNEHLSNIILELLEPAGLLAIKNRRGSYLIRFDMYRFLPSCYVHNLPSMIKKPSWQIPDEIRLLSDVDPHINLYQHLRETVLFRGL